MKYALMLSGFTRVLAGACGDRERPSGEEGANGIAAEVHSPVSASDGHVVPSETLVVHSREFATTFWPALQVLLELPIGLTIPCGLPEKQIIENPDNREVVWDDRLTVMRAANSSRCTTTFVPK